MQSEMCDENDSWRSSPSEWLVIFRQIIPNEYEFAFAYMPNGIDVLFTVQLVNATEGRYKWTILNWMVCQRTLVYFRFIMIISVGELYHLPSTPPDAYIFWFSFSQVTTKMPRCSVPLSCKRHLTPLARSAERLCIAKMFVYMQPLAIKLIKWI